MDTKSSNTIWEVPPRIPPEITKHFSDFPKLFQQILFNRGILNQEGANRFINADFDLIDPFCLRNMRKSITIIQDVIQNEGIIVVLGDYDVDGVTATALLVQTLWKLNAKAIKFIPNRFEEGYGFSMDAFEQIRAFNPELIISVDCGVRSIKEIQAAKNEGIKVIVTDHHQPFSDIPAADAILCPRLPGEEYPNKDLAGVGIAFKLAQALDQEFPSRKINSNAFLDLVALGTIADLARLTHENRALVRKGLEVLNKATHPGLRALARVSGIEKSEISAEDIGFRLGPRLNAAGRLESAQYAFDLLICTTDEEAASCALKLDQLNRDRQQITKSHVEKVFQDVDDKVFDQIIFHADEKFNLGVVGLVASRIAERFFHPAIIGGIDDEIIHASCRSIPGIDITAALDDAKDLLIQHGGHAMAAGLTMKRNNVPELEIALNSAISIQLNGKKLQPVIKAECEASLFDLKPELLSFINKLEPTGIGNPKPLFITRNVTVGYPKTVGSNNDHLKFKVSEIEGGSRRSGSITFDAIGFRFGNLKNQIKENPNVDILYSFELNHYNGRSTLQLNIKDIKIS